MTADTNVDKYKRALLGLSNEEGFKSISQVPSTEALFIIIFNN